MSSFHGLEMAKQALFAQQAALYTTGHNMANANTEGYSRQRVNFETMSPYPAPGRNRPEMPGQMGTGVKIGTVERIRDRFLDVQFRAENSKTGYWDTKADALKRMEELMNEPSDSGLSKTMSEFWDSLQELSANPTNSGARSVVASRALAVTETFNHLSKSLNAIRTDLGEQIDVTVDQANSLLRQINQINEQVQKVEPHGYLPNDLYDKRDLLIDELSQIMNIKVSYSESSTSSLDIGQGIASIELVDAQGKSFGSPVHLIERIDSDGEPSKVGLPVINVLELDISENNAIVTIDGTNVGMESIGSLSGLLESYDRIYPNMLEQLDKLAFEFAVKFNEEHSKGYGLDKENGRIFFSVPSEMNAEDPTGMAGLITVDKDILENTDYIAASSDETSGNGDYAQLLADFFSNPLDGLDGKSVNSYFESMIGKLGVDAKEANRNSTNTNMLKSQVVEQRMSVSAVSLDEEMTNMIKFQHAYNAAARSMTTIDEMLERIINGMGLVGR